MDTNLKNLIERLERLSTEDIDKILYYFNWERSSQLSFQFSSTNIKTQSPPNYGEML